MKQNVNLKILHVIKYKFSDVFEKKKPDQFQTLIK